MSKPATVDLDGLVTAIIRQAAKPRLMIAIAGPPGGGKSTLSDALLARLEARDPGSAAIMPMDGYHFDDLVLVPRGLRPRKGAPETFDVAGFAHMLARLKRNAEPEIAVPVFDRDLEIARAGARLIPQSVRILVVEGNYLLLGQEPWSALHPLFDITVLLREPEAVLRARLVARWQGYDLPAAEVTAKVETNDLPNGRLVLANSIVPDYVVAP